VYFFKQCNVKGNNKIEENDEDLILQAISQKRYLKEILYGGDRGLDSAKICNIIKTGKITNLQRFSICIFLGLF